MDVLVWAAIGALALAVALVAGLLLAPRRPQVDITRLDPTAQPAVRGWAAVPAGAGRLGDRVLRRLGRRAALVAVLERADVHWTPARLLVVTVSGTVAGNVVGGLLGGPLLAVALTPVVMLTVVAVLRVRTSRRRTAFDEQLDDTLRLLASSLRAGHSVLRAMEAVAHDAAAPTSDEFSRVLNEVRVGRDVVLALEEVGARMGSDDFAWVAQAVAVHREVGGNLAEVLDRVGTTVRDRSSLRRQARALSAEGRISAIVLLTLPVAAGAALQVAAPEYAGRLTSGGAGTAMLAAAALLMAVGALWVRRVVTVRF